MGIDDTELVKAAARSQRRLLVAVLAVSLLGVAVSMLPWLGVGYCVIVGSTACPAMLSPQIAQGPRDASSERDAQTTERAPGVTGQGEANAPVMVSTEGNLPTANPKYVALVIGNSTYARPNSPLKNPKNDAVAIAETLKKLNYTLIGGGAQHDLGYDAMRRAVIAFKTAAAQAEVGLIYYAGHGIQIDDKEPIYLIPIDAKLLKKEELEIEGVPLSFVTAALPNRVLTGGVEQVGVVILDACRTSNYPLDGVTRGTGQRGLKAVKAPKRSFIAFSATAGEPASDGNDAATNSPYAQSLLKHLNDRDDPDFKALFDRVDRDFEENGEQQTPVKDDKLATRRIPVATAERPPPVWTKKRDCDVCPEVVVLPKGTFLMGALEAEAGSEDNE